MKFLFSIAFSLAIFLSPSTLAVSKPSDIKSPAVSEEIQDNSRFGFHRKSMIKNHKNWSSEYHSGSIYFHILRKILHFVLFIFAVFIAVYVGRIAWDKAGKRK
jgi:hypothetical protein